MNKNTVEGNLEQVKGAIKETVGKVVGNDRLEAEGEAQKVAGKAQEGLGKTQQAAEDAAKKLRD